MTLSDERLAELLAYCREDPPETADAQIILTIRGLYGAAVGYLKEAGISEPAVDTERKAQYDLLVNALVLDGLDNRGTQIENTLAENPAFRRTLNQLKFTEGAVSSSDTSTAT